jgi:glycerate 2-kinase
MGSSLGDIVRAIALEALAACSPEDAVRRVLQPTPTGARVGDRQWDGPFYVLSVGKAASAMARAASDLLGNLVWAGSVLTRDGYSDEIPFMNCLEAGHPLPDARSLNATADILREIDALPDDVTILMLLSGGGSALFEAPDKGISLEDIRAVNAELLTCGASIAEVNAVRKHLSRVKGGKLLRRISPRSSLALVVSDVVGDDLATISSGPTVADHTTFADAVEVLKRRDLWGKTPKNVRHVLEEGLKGLREETLKSVEGYDTWAQVILDNRSLCRAAGEAAKIRGFTPLFLGSFFSGEAREIGTFVGEIAREIRASKHPGPPPVAVISGGESVVKVRGKGRGGPGQEAALACARALRGLSGVAFLAMDSDGTDGPTDAAGGVVDGTTWDHMESRGLNPLDALERNDAYAVLGSGGGLWKTGPTGNNLNDLRILLVEE